MIKILGPLLPLLFLGLGPLHADELGQSVLGLKQEIKHVTLENGLHLILVRRPFSPTVAAYIKFRAGGVDETDESAGIAHMLKHPAVLLQAPHPHLS